MINSGESIALVECLGLQVDNTPERVSSTNIIQKFYKNPKFIQTMSYDKNNNELLHKDRFEKRR